MIVRFVKRPHATEPVTILDLPSDGGVTGLHVEPGTLSLGAPAWEGEPGSVDPDDGYREIEFTAAMYADFSRGAEEISKLSRLLTKPSGGWLMVQRDADHQPMFFRYYRTAQEAMSWEDVASNDTLRVPVRLVCDPTAYGAPVTHGPYTVDNNPLSTTNLPAAIELPDIVGDSPTDLVVSATPSNQWTHFTCMVSTEHYYDSYIYDGPLVWDLVAAQWAAGADTGGDTNSAQFVGGSNRTCDFSTSTNLVPRLTGGPIGPPPPGRYKVMLRVASNGETGTYSEYTLRIDQLASTQGITVHEGEPKKFGATGTHRAYVDMGEYAFPFGVTRLDENDNTVAPTPRLQILASRDEGAANLLLDALVLIPISSSVTEDSSRIMFTTFHYVGEPGGSLNKTAEWDGYRRRYVTYINGELGEYQAPRLMGGWPRAIPGARNVVTILQQCNPVDGDGNVLPDAVGASQEVYVSYMPRYLHIAPDGG